MRAGVPILPLAILAWGKWSLSRPSAQGWLAPRVQSRRLLRAQGSSAQNPDSIFKDGDLPKFKDCHIVPVEEAWRELLHFVITQQERIALIRAPPRSGKSFLGELGSLKVPNGPWGEVEVRYCANVGNPKKLDKLVAHGGYADVDEMAMDSALSGEDSSRKTIVYYLDEAHKLPQSIIDAFVKSGARNGYAIFATAGRATLPKSFITPPELVARTFFYVSPAPLTTLRAWLQVKFEALLQTATEAEPAADLLLNVAAGNVGLITFFGDKLEQHHCRDLLSVREKLRELLSDYKDVYVRTFGVENGKPDAVQTLLISALRCCGSLTKTSATGQKLPLWDAEDASHRHGLSKAYYAAFAPGTDLSRCLVQVCTEATISFVHPLQPEIYASKFKFSWTDIGLQDRWITNFACSDSEPAETPKTVLDLVLSWLSHVEIHVLLLIHKNIVDAPEKEFQTSFYLFCKDILKLSPVEREKKTRGGFVDMFIEGNMGIELFIRASRGNLMTAEGLLTNSATRGSLIEHAERAKGKYNEIAQNCAKGYITVLPATLVDTTPDQEWVNFQALATNELAQVGYPVVVAVAPFGWAEWDVFIHRPGQEPMRVQVPRQQLMLKLSDGAVVSARQFYPQPEEVWVQQLTRDMQLMGRAFKIKPAPDDVAALAVMIKDAESLTCPLSQLAIYRQNWKGEWEEAEEDSVLFENTKQSPYGFLTPG